jgi:hypothetical protein
MGIPLLRRAEVPCRQNTSFDSTTIMNSLVTASGSLEFWEERLASQPWIAAHSETPTPIEEEIDDYFELQKSIFFLKSYIILVLCQ